MNKPTPMGMFAWFAIIIMIVSSITPVFADEAIQGDAQLRKMESQIMNLQDIIKKQNNEIQNIKSNMASPGAERVATPVATVAPTIDKEDFLAASKEAYPWMSGLKQGGDFRMRYEAFDSSNCDPDTTGVGAGAVKPTLLSCSRSQNRFRIRLRYGFEKKLNDEWLVGFRLATGSTTDPTSTNTTLSGYFNYKAILLDQAYAIYTPNLLKNLGPLEGVEIGLGKFKNPFEKYSTKMVWDRDVTPEGIYEKSVTNLWLGDKNTVKWDLTGGQFLLNEGTGKGVDAQMFGVQTGIDASTFMFGTERAVESRTGFSFYSFHNYDDTVGANTSTANLLRGNSTDIERIRMFDLYQEFKMYPFGKPLTFWGEFVLNEGADSPSSDRFPPAGKRDRFDPRDANAFAIGTQLGEAKKKGEWEAFFNYQYIGANSVSGFGDSDFGLGHTNGKGVNFGLGYALTDFLVFNWSNFVVAPVEPHNDIALSSDRVAQTIYRSQVDLVWKF